jgi:integrase
MKQRYHLFTRGNGVFYSLDTIANKQKSLNTKDAAEARRFLNALNEACQQPAINLQMAQVYLQHSDPEYGKRTWEHVMDEAGKNKQGPTKIRWDRAMGDKAFDRIRHLKLIQTQAEHFFDALHKGTVSTNVFLRRLQNFALDMDWIAKSIIPKRQWPEIKFKEKRAITLVEHLAIVAREQNPERKAFYKLAWYLGASQSDLAFLEAENVDWDNNVISYKRMKTGTVAIMRLDEDMAEILRDLPGNGPLFPYLRTVRAGDRATEFKQRCTGLGIKGVSLHSYRYAWAERAKTAGYPERFAQVNIGHNSRAMTRAYSRNAPVEMPALSEYEKRQKAIIGNRNTEPAAQIVTA